VANLNNLEPTTRVAKKLTKIKFHSLVLLLLLVVAHGLRAQGTAFIYQGTLNVSGVPANGSYDLRFTLYDAATNGDEIGSVTNAATSINGGSFMATLDFGGVFSGTNYWLEIAARTNVSGAFTTLSPRQPVLPAPYAIYSANSGNATVAGSANSVAGSNIVGTVGFTQLPTSILTNNATGVVLNGTFSGNAGGLTNIQATNLTGMVPIASLPDPEAQAFCISNNITDPVVQSDVTGFVRELRASGSFNLLVDGMLLHPRFNPTNQLSFFGNQETVSNLAFSSWGAQFNGASSIRLPLASAVTSNTLVFVFRSPYMTADSEEFVLGLANTTNLSADWLWEDGNAGAYQVWQRSGGYFPYGGYTGYPLGTAADVGFPYENLVQPRWINGYSSTEGAARMNERKVFAFSNDGKGNSQIWEDTVPALIGYYTPGLTNSSPVVNSDPMNVLCVGQDYTNFPNYPPNFGPWNGEMSAVLVFKGVLTSNQVNSVYRAVRWLEPDTVERLFVGDSLTAADAPGTNNYPQFFQNGKPGQNCWRNNAQPGATALEFTNYPLTSISSLPYPSKVKEIDVYYAFGINDLYGNGDTVANILGYTTNTINSLSALGAKVYYVTICHIWQYANMPYYYNAGIDASGVAIDQFFYTNIGAGNLGLAGIIPKDQIVSQPLLDIDNNFSKDGLHFYGPLGYVANQAVADYMLGKPYISGYSVPNPNHPVWPYDAYGNVWLNPTTTMPGPQIAGVIPSSALAGSYSSAVNLTNPGNHISGNGSGLTKIPAAAISGGLTTNIVISGHTLTYSNGVLVNLQ